MTDYIVSARKYRPKSFDAVVGQENITQTLARAIEKNQLGSSFLFCGPRGVGKTTCARILAREVNQFHSDNPENDPDFAFNIFELDAASNNGVDGIRDLIDQVRIPPQTGKYKVYIIDEVHMLSTSAFNAFLKTLEEPPPYAIFILATTEKHKILPTIISRCQVFDFNRIEVSDIVKQLSDIAEREGINAESEALHIIAEKADGAMRDALSIFDRLASSATDDTGITYAAAIKNLNILDHDYFFRVVDAALANDISEMMVTYDSIMRAGFEGSHFLSGLANHMRNLLMAISARTVNIIVGGETVKKRYLEQSQRATTEQLVEALEILGAADTSYKASQNQRLLVEIALLKLCNVFGGAKKKTEPVPNDGEGRESNGVAPADTDYRAERQPTPQSAPAPESPPKGESPTPAAEEREEAPSPKSEETQVKADDAPAGSVREEGRPYAQDNGEEENLSPAEETGAKTPQEDSPEKPESSELPANAPSQEHTHKNPPPPTDRPAFLGNLKGRQIKGMTSLSDLKKKVGNPTVEREESAAEAEPDGPMKPFTLQQLWDVWDAYSEMVRAKDMPSYHATLTKRRPVMREAGKVEFLVDNHVQLAYLNEDKPDLLEYLRSNLENRGIQLAGVIDEEEDDDFAPYDPKHKYAKMAEKNPALQKFRSAFDLDIEHDY